MRPQRNDRTRGRRRPRDRRREGAALLVVMIIVAITTAAAAISVQNTTVEMHAAGRERILTQTRYASEAAMQASIIYLDLISRSGGFEQLWTVDWPEADPPEVREFTGGHQITELNRHHAARMSQEQQNMLLGARLLDPVSGPDETLPIPDLTGSFGPGQPYSMEPYIIDITDCFMGAKIPGDNLNDTTRARFFCTLTVRGRVSMNDDAGAFVSWDLPGGFNGVLQERSGAAHDLRVTIETPPVPIPSGNQ